MIEHIHYKMLRNLILHITYLISRLHSSINKRIASLFEMISAIRGARQQHPLSMNAGSTLLQRRTVKMLVRRCTELDMTGSSKASQFWDADAPFASASLVEMQKSPGLEGPLGRLQSNILPPRQLHSRLDRGRLRKIYPSGLHLSQRYLAITQNSTVRN